MLRTVAPRAGCSPATPAGLFGSTSRTITPSTPKNSASWSGAGVTPKFTGCVSPTRSRRGTVELIRSTGTAKPMPALSPPRE